MSIQYEIEQQLESLNKQQQCRFAWQCGLRALPFLSTTRKFAYWSEDAIPVYLETIFSSLIVTAEAAFTNYFVDDEYDCPFTTLAYEAAKAAYYNSSDIAGHVVESVVCGSLAAGSKVSAVPYGNKVITLVAQAAEHANTAAEQAGFDFIKDHLFYDIENIRLDEFEEMNNRRDLYGDLFFPFQLDLRDVGCSHFSKLIDGLFEDRFKISESLLLNRSLEQDKQKRDWFNIQRESTQRQ